MLNHIYRSTCIQNFNPFSAKEELTRFGPWKWQKDFKSRNIGISVIFRQNECVHRVLNSYLMDPLFIKLKGDLVTLICDVRWTQWVIRVFRPEFTRCIFNQIIKHPFWWMKRCGNFVLNNCRIVQFQLMMSTYQWQWVQNKMRKLMQLWTNLWNQKGKHK